MNLERTDSSKSLPENTRETAAQAKLTWNPLTLKGASNILKAAANIPSMPAQIVATALALTAAGAVGLGGAAIRPIYRRMFRKSFSVTDKMEKVFEKTLLGSTAITSFAAGTVGLTQMSLLLGIAATEIDRHLEEKRGINQEEALDYNEVTYPEFAHSNLLVAKLIDTAREKTEIRQVTKLTLENLHKIGLNIVDILNEIDSIENKQQRRDKKNEYKKLLLEHYLVSKGKSEKIDREVSPEDLSILENESNGEAVSLDSVLERIKSWKAHLPIYLELIDKQLCCDFPEDQNFIEGILYIEKEKKGDDFRVRLFPNEEIKIKKSDNFIEKLNEEIKKFDELIRILETLHLLKERGSIPVIGKETSIGKYLSIGQLGRQRDRKPDERQERFREIGFTDNAKNWSVAAYLEEKGLAQVILPGEEKKEFEEGLIRIEIGPPMRVQIGEGDAETLEGEKSDLVDYLLEKLQPSK